MSRAGSLRHHLQMYAMSLRLQSAMWVQYRVDYITGLFYVVLEQVVMLALFGVIFSNIPTLADWTLYEMLIVYGFTRVAVGITDSFTENLWLVPGYAEDGSLTDYLVRPVNIIFQLLSEHLHFERLFSCLIGIVLIAYGSAAEGFTWSFGSTAVAVYFTLLGSTIYGSIMLLGASLTIFFIGASIAMQGLWSVTEFAKYPATIFGRAGNTLFLTVLPIGVIGYVPSSLLFRPGLLPSVQTFILSTLFTLLFVVVCHQIWLSSLRSYNGTGT